MKIVQKIKIACKKGSRTRRGELEEDN